MATLSWLVAILLGIYAWSLGFLDMRHWEVAAISGLIMMVTLLMDFAMRRGWNLRFRDPSLTLPQVLFAIFIALLVVSRTTEARGVMLMLFMMAMMFGLFQLGRREFALVAAVAILGFGGLYLFEIVSGRSERGDELRLLELGGFSIIMGWMAYIGGYVSRLRKNLSARNTELHELNDKLHFLAGHDELTGLPNRRRMMDRLEQAQISAESQAAPFCILMLDLDRFKRVNDRHGHAVGDQVLVEFARRTQQALRGHDTIARVDDSIADMGRFGGEEFLAIVHDSDIEGARLAAERLRQSVAGQPFETNAGPIDCTVSVGVAQHHPPEPLRITLLRADQALYQAKATGRNRSVVETELEHSATT